MRRPPVLRGGFTLLEILLALSVLSVILLLLLSAFTGAARVRETLSARSRGFRQVRLVLHPSDGTYQFLHPDRPTEEKRTLEFGSRLSVTGIRIEGEDRLLDIPTEIRYLPGGRVAAARIFLRDDGGGNTPSQWTLRLSPFDGSIRILKGTVREDG